MIRSYVGANSGPSTQRTHIFYDRREDIVTNLRVHSIPAIMDFFDYSPAAAGMTYRNEPQPGRRHHRRRSRHSHRGRVHVGAGHRAARDDQPGRSSCRPRGPRSITSYYLDDSTPSDTQCTGDAFAYGSSGLCINSTLPSTDPAIGGTDSLIGTRTLYFEAPGATAADAAARRDQVLAPLTRTVTAAP